ncbi:ATP-binding protein [Nakamurella sp. GG22]
MVGRETAMAAADAAIGAAVAGAGGLLLVSGDPGIGKSRFVQAVAERAADRELQPAWGYAVEDAGAPALWPWQRACRDWPEVTSALDTGPDGAGLQDARTSFVMFMDVCERIVEVSRQRGVLLVLEDMHWADRTSVALLRHLAGELERSNLLVVVTYRQETPGALSDALADLARARNVTTIALEGLRAADIHTWLDASGFRAADDLAAALRERTGGNALLVKLVTQALSSIDAGADPRAVDRLLAGRADLRRLIASRTAALDPSGREAVAAASVLGERLDPGILATIVDQPVSSATDALQTAVGAGVLRESTTPGEFAFAHALVRDAIYADLPASARGRWHRRCATALESVAAESVAAEPAAGIIANHWRRATGADAGAHCLRWAKLAARQAGSAFAYEDAAGFAELALRCATESGESAADLAELTVMSAEAYFAAGNIDASLDACTRASDLALAAGRPDLMAAAGLVIQGIGTPVLNRRIRALCERALAASDDAPVTTARLLVQIAAATAEDEGGSLAEERSARALAAAEATGDPVAILEALAARHLAIAVPNMVTERLELGRRAVELGKDADRPLATMWGHLWRADAAHQVGNLVEVDREIDSIDEIATRRRSALARWHHHRMLAARTALTGDFALARTHNRHATELAHRMGDLSLAGMSYAFSLQLAQVRGDPTELPPDFMRAIEHSPPLPLVKVGRVMALALAGDTAAARACFESFRDLPRTYPVGVRWAATLAQIGLTAVLLDDAEVADTVYERLAPDALYYSGDGSGAVYYYGSNSGWLGTFALTAGRVDEAVRLFRDAIAMNARIGARPATALARLGLAQALLARTIGGQGNPTDLTEARVLATDATGEFRRLDMPGPLAFATAVLADLATARPAGPALSPRESEIAGLVGASLSNRAIAERLFLSERTVESHVRNILSKLGFASRTEIVLWAADRRTPSEAARQKGQAAQG